MNIENNMSMSAFGEYKIAVVDAKTKEVVWEQKEWRKNLILNRGMQEVANRSWEQCFFAGICGTSNSANYLDSGLSTAASDAAGNVTIAGGGTFAFSNPGDIGNILKWDTLQEHRVQSITNGSTAFVVPAPGGAGIAAGEFTFFYTNRTQLVSESKRSITYLTGAPNCTSSRTGNLLQMRRTYDFTAEVGSVTYNEVGVGWSSTFGAANTTFARIVLPVGVSLIAGQQLRLIYQLNLFIGPSVATAGSMVVTGWPVAPTVDTNGTYGIQLIGFQNVATTGNAGNYDAAGACNEPTINGLSRSVMWASESSTALAAYATTPPFRTFGGSGPTVNSGNALLPTQVDAVTGSVAYSIVKRGTWPTGAANSTQIRSFGMATDQNNSFNDPTDDTGFAFVFNSNQTKANTQTLTINCKYTWSRVFALD